MEDFDEAMELEPETTRSGKSGMIGVWIGIIGIVVGVTGIILANQAQSKVRALEIKMARSPDQSAEVKNTLTSLDERIVRLGSEFVKLGRQDRQLQENTQAAFDAVTRDIRTNRETINELTERLSQILGRPMSTSATTAKATPAVTEEKESEAVAVEEVPQEAVQPRIHIVQSGDTLSRIAKMYGVSPTRLQQANPSIDPRALQIGQRVVIPGP